MARIRTIKPQFFKNEQMAELPMSIRLLFIGLLTLADKEGRFEDRPKRIKAELFPYDNIEVDKELSRLQSAGFIERYEVGELKVIQINNFKKHQRITGKEAQIDSEYPPPQLLTERETMGKQWGNNGETTGTTGKEGKGKEGKGYDGKEKESPPPIPASLVKNIDDLKTDCLKDQVYFVEHVSRQCKVPTDSILAHLELFNAHLKSIGEMTKGARDYRNHFQNWLKKQPAVQEQPQGGITAQIKLK